MHLEQSHYLWLLLAIPGFLCYALVSYREANGWLYRFARAKKRPLPYAVATLFLGLALAAVICSLADPRVRYDKVVFNRSGIDVAIGIDVSKSMLAEDEALPEEGRKLFTVPNRLNRARYWALNLINALRGERVAVFMFASKGVSIVPFTGDYGYCQYILKHVSDTAIAIPGSDLSQAIATGVAQFEESSRNSAKAIVLISDGEDISGDTSRIFEAAQRAATRGIAIFTVGTGSGQPVLIPIRDSGSSIVDYYQDEDGSFLKTRLDQETLKGISDSTGGRYFGGRDERGEEGLIDAILKRARTIEYTRATEPAWFYLSPLLLCAAFLFFAIGILVGR